MCTGKISSKISAFQNQIQETNENNRKEQAIKKELSSKNLKNWDQKINDNNIKKEPETKSKENIVVQPPPPVEVEKTVPEPQPEIKKKASEPKSDAKQVINLNKYIIIIFLIK